MIYYVYHIRRDKDACDLKKGYIGISNNPERRFKDHKRSGNKHLLNALSLYNDVALAVLSSGTKAHMLEVEAWLRPEENIGWNIAKGGGMPPPSKKKFEEKLCICKSCGVEFVVKHHLRGYFCTTSCYHASLVGKRQTSETSEKMAINSPKSKPVEIGGVCYPSMRSAARALNIKPATLFYRIKKGLQG